MPLPSVRFAGRLHLALRCRRSTPLHDAAPVLEWCLTALARGGHGDPVGVPEHELVGWSCPAGDPLSLHLLDHRVAVVPRRARRGDGVEVDALCWTTLEQVTRSVFLNLENDDYGRLWRDDEPCGCLFGSLGLRGRVGDVRGLTKVVTGGVTVPGGTLEELADQVLPARFGGSPGDWQFTEAEDGHGASRLVVRAHPGLGPLPEADVAAGLNDTAATVVRSDPTTRANPSFVRYGSVACDRTSSPSARQTSSRSRLRTTRHPDRRTVGADGQWRSSRNWVDEYLRNRWRRGEGS